MSETAPDTGTRPIEGDAKPSIEHREFKGILKALIGKKCTVVNPESYEAATVGFQLKEGYYAGKISGPPRLAIAGEPLRELRLEIPVQWVRVHQPSSVVLRRITYAALVIWATFSVWL